MSNNRIGIRLAVGFSVVVLVFLTSMALISVSLNHLTRDIKQVDEETLPFILVVDEMDVSRAEVQQFLTDVSATHNRDGYKDADEAARRFLDGASKFRQMYQHENDAGNLKKIELIEANFNSFYSSGKEMAEGRVTVALDVSQS